MSPGRGDGANPSLDITYGGWQRFSRRPESMDTYCRPQAQVSAAAARIEVSVLGLPSPRFRPCPAMGSP
jgi:hypothetical protein